MIRTILTRFVLNKELTSYLDLIIQFKKNVFCLILIGRECREVYFLQCSKCMNENDQWFSLTRFSRMLATEMSQS